MQLGKVFFIGAGPGDPELITVKAKRIIETADLVLYAGSLVPRAIVDCAKASAKVVDSAPLNLEECHEIMLETLRQGGIVARVHTGDPSLYGTIREQIHLLSRYKVDYEVIPGITTACAAAAAAGISFTVPAVTQSLVLTRLGGRTPVPTKEELKNFAALSCSIAVYLSASKSRELEDELCASLPNDTPVLCAYRVGWPEQKLVWATADTLYDTVCEHKFERQTIFLVLPGQNALPTTSKLYAPDFKHMWRK